MMRKIITCIMMVCVMFSVCACGDNDNGRTDFTYEEVMQKFQGEMEQNATIRVLDNQMSVETGHLTEMLTAFNEKYKSFNVKAVDANMDQYVNLEQNGPDGYGPDVLFQANDMIMRYAENQHVLPLPVKDIEGNEKISDTVLSSYKKNTYGLDLHFGMPVALQSTVLTYRKDLLPQNWETEWDKNKNSVPDMVENINDMYKYSKTVKTESNGKKYGLYMSLVDQYFNSGYLLSYGAYVFGNDSNDIGLNASGAEKGLNLYRDLAGVLGSECISQDPTTQVSTYLTDAKGTVFATIGTPDWLTVFQKNLTATYKAQGKTDAEAKELAAANLVQVAPPSLPKDGNIKKDITNMAEELMPATSMGGVNAIAISSYTKYPKASLAFVKFVNEYEKIEKRCAALGAIPARSDIAEKVGGITKVINDREKAGNIYIMPSTRDTMYIWSPLESLFKDVATDNTSREVPKYTSAESLKTALDKLVTDVRSAMAIGKG